MNVHSCLTRTEFTLQAFPYQKVVAGSLSSSQPSIFIILLGLCKSGVLCLFSVKWHGQRGSILLALEVGIDRVWSQKLYFFRESGSKNHPHTLFELLTHWSVSDRQRRRRNKGSQQHVNWGIIYSLVVRGKKSLWGNRITTPCSLLKACVEAMAGRLLMQT